jgi:hypothetical protein
MRSYTVCRAGGNPEWDKIEKAEIDNIRRGPENIRAWAQLCYDDEFLKVRLSAIEKEPLIRFDDLLAMVHLDSCLEFFFRPGGNEGPYFNFEFNPKGTNNFGFGMNREDLARIIFADYRERFRVNPFAIRDGWGMEFSVPVALFKLVNPSFQYKPGLTASGNFYKCGAETKTPHALTWNRIENEKANFHSPEFFGRIVFA